MAIDASALQQLAMTGLAGQPMSDAQRQAMEEALFGNAQQDIERTSGVNAQAALENAFGRGVGQGGMGGASSITNYGIGNIERARSDALVKARNDAAVASRNAQLAALGSAAGTAQNALTQQTQSGQNTEALKLQRRGQDMAQSSARNQMIGQGVGGLGGAAATVGGLVYGPEIKSALKSLVAGGGGGKTGFAGANGPSSPAIEGAPAADAGAPIVPAAGGGGALNLMSGGPDISPVSFSAPSFSGGGGLDLSSFQFPDFNMDWSNILMPQNSNWDWSF